MSSPILAPFQNTYRGASTFLEGVRWLRAHPRHLTLLFVPMVLGLVFIGSTLTGFVGYSETILSWVLFDEPEGFWLGLLYWLCKILLYIAAFVFVLIGGLLVMNVIAAPIYEIVSMAVERDITGKVSEGLSLWATLKLMLEELKKVAFILGVSILLLLIPGINVISTLVTAGLVGWDFYDYPLARRGWSFRERLQLVGKDWWGMMGFGLWLVIPFAQIFLLPLAVAGGTILSLRALENRALVPSTRG